MTTTAHEDQFITHPDDLPVVLHKLGGRVAQSSGNAVELHSAIMTEVQEFASTWAIVDGRFDDGTAIDRAEACKAEIDRMLRAALSAQEQK